jgi:hypothetical protein
MWWFRFGDEGATPGSVELKVQDYPTATGSLDRSYQSGMLVDSGPHQWHLMYRGGQSTTTYLTAVSGLASYSVSGAQFGGSTWDNGDIGNVLFFHPEQISDAGVGASNFGFTPCPMGAATYPSGFTVMGWIQVPPDDGTNSAFARQIFGNYKFASAQGGTFSAFNLSYRPSDYSLSVRYRFAGDTLRTIVNTAGTPYPLPVDEPAFVAVQFHRENEIPGGWNNNVQGSGVVNIFVGTTVSGLTKIATHEFNDNDTRFIRTTATENIWAFAQDSLCAEGTATETHHIPPNSILDEWVCVLDGHMEEGRIAHYMNSGINHLTTSDPTHPDFVPENPASTNLVAYWTFDDQTGTNSANSNDLLDVLMENVTPVPGIRGGSGIRPNAEVDRDNTVTPVTDFPRVPGESGINYLFPDINVSHEWTWIGWMNPQSTGSITRYGGALGWFSTDTSDHTAWGIGDWSNGFSAGPGVDRGRGIEYSPSGISDSVSNGPLAGLANVGGGLAGTKEDAWQLWGLVFDFKTNVIYSVRDAKRIRVEDVRIGAESGLSKEMLLSDPNSFFGWAAINDTSTTSRPLFDDWAVFSRKLTLPEMSGFALSGLVVQPDISPFSTSFKQTYGYWIFDDSNEVIYDPDGVSGVRYNDQSWYRHHLTNVSGAVEVSDTELNSTVSSNSLQVNVSGSIVLTERAFTGSILDFSTSSLMSSSGFSAGAFVYLPSGDLETQGNGSSGLYGDHHIMGSWGTEADNNSWQLGISDNIPFLNVRIGDSSIDTVTANEEVPFDTPFFIAASVRPSGGSTIANLYVNTDDVDDATLLRNVGYSPSLTSLDALHTSTPSGFSLFNVAGRQQGFPSGTLIQAPFVYAGGASHDELSKVGRLGFNNDTLGTNSVSNTDPANISHWRFDRAGKFAIDFGREQNHLFPVNEDGHGLGVQPAIHESGAVVRQTEYFDTIPNNSQAKRLDLGSGSQSWTALGWVIPPSVSATDEHVILNKGSGPDSSPTGVKIYSPSDSLQAIAVASGDVTTSAQNGDLAPQQWNHLAVTYDRDNDEFAVMVNGRYAGTSFVDLVEVPINNSGLALGGRGDAESDALAGGSAFSGLLDDWMLFSRALTLPEISGLAANSYNFNTGTQNEDTTVGMWIEGLAQNIVSGLVGAYMYGVGEQTALTAGHISGVSGTVSTYGGYIHGKIITSGLVGGFLHGADSQSGIFGHFMRGVDVVSGLVGHYMFGSCETSNEFDATLTFQIVTSSDFDARLAVEKTEIYSFDAKLGVIRITQPPECTLELPVVGTITSGLPYTLTVRGSGIAQDDKDITQVRFTFADFKGAEKGTLIDGVPFSGLYEASRVFDTPGWYTIKIEVLDSYGYRTSCARPFLLLPSGSTSGAYLATLPGISLSGTPTTGSSIHRAFLTHSLSGLDTTSGILEYTDFADMQESLVNSLEVPSGTQFIDFVRTHDYTMPGHYTPVWAMSGQWGIVSDSLSDGIDYLE